MLSAPGAAFFERSFRRRLLDYNLVQDYPINGPGNGPSAFTCVAHVGEVSRAFEDLGNRFRTDFFATAERAPLGIDRIQILRAGFPPKFAY